MSLRHVKSGPRERIGLSRSSPRRDNRKVSRRASGPSRGHGLVAVAMVLGAAGGLVAAMLTGREAELGTEVTAREAESLSAPEPADTSADKSAAPDLAAATPAEEPAPAPRVESPLARAATVLKRSVTDRVRRGETLSVALSRHGVELDAVNRLALALKGKLDLRAIRPGDVYVVEQVVCGEAPKAPCEGGEALPDEGPLPLDRFEFKPASFIGAPVTVRAVRAGEGYEVSREETPIETKVVALGGEINSSLYVSMIAQGEDSNLVSRFVDVFAWDIDFYRQTQKGDRYKVIVEKQYAAGRFVGYGRVLAAEYVNVGEVHRGFNFRSGNGKVAGIFDDKGKAMEKTFLKNPLEVARITSRYGQRFHPVLRRQKKHNGVDYGAARGTPFWAVADGVVKEARYSRTAGNMIVLRHANGYETEYFHASRFAGGIRAGVKVKQRQIIGYVGNTGRSTGPHLHYGMRRTGAYVNPSKQVFPVARPVPDRYLEEYLEFIKPLLAEIEAVEIS